MPISNKIVDRMKQGNWVRLLFEEGIQLKADLGPENVFDFTIGNPAEGPPEIFREALRNLAENPIPGMHGYMPNAGHPHVRKKIASHISEECGIEVPFENLVMTAGAGGALNVALHCLLNPGDEVIILSPYFLEYPIYIENHGGNTVIAKTSPDYLLDIQAIDQAITERTKAIILNSPNNPSGVVYPSEQLGQLGDLLRSYKESSDRDIYLLCDEPYKNICTTT